MKRSYNTMETYLALDMRSGTKTHAHAQQLVFYEQLDSFVASCCKQVGYTQPFVNMEEALNYVDSVKRAVDFPGMYQWKVGFVPLYSRWGARPPPDAPHLYKLVITLHTFVADMTYVPKE